MKAFGCTDVGKVRPVNEDNYCIYEDIFKLYIVADGMGGHKGGDVASSLAIEYIKEHLIKFIEIEMEPRDIEGIIFESFNRANTEVYNKSLNEEDCNGMGTTVTLALTINEKVYIGHVGDSRAYLYSKGEIKQITEDHSLVAELVKNGSITAREARRHPQKNIITRALGTEKNIKVDIFSLDLIEQDIIILCTDGLSNYIDEIEIKSIIDKFGVKNESCQELVYLANKKGGCDNITIIIVKNTQLE